MARWCANWAPASSPVSAFELDGKALRPSDFVYWLVNKPRGCLCTNYDPSRRPLVLDLVPHISQRVYTVGRLDEDSEGLVLLTNDGELAHKLMHPRFGVEKTYLVLVAGSPTRPDLQQLMKGVFLAEGQVKAKSVKRLKRQGDSTWLRIVLAEGKNREIRRMLAKLQHKVMRLRRIAIGPVEIGKLSKGKSRRAVAGRVGVVESECGRRSLAGTHHMPMRQPKDDRHVPRRCRSIDQSPASCQDIFNPAGSTDLARAINPGQFLMVRLPGSTDPLLGRPFALYDTALDGQGLPVAVDVVYLVVGKVTAAMAGIRPGAQS